MSYRVLARLIKAFCFPCVYLVSYYCFSTTSVYALASPFFGAGARMFLYITLFVAVYFLLISLVKGDAGGFLFLVCGFFCFVAAAGYSKMNWITALVQYLFHFPLVFQTGIAAPKTAVLCLLVLWGCLVIWFVSRWEKEYDAVISGGLGRDEVSPVFNSQTGFLALALAVAFFTTTAFCLVLARFDEIINRIDVLTNISPALLALAGILLFAALLYAHLAGPARKGPA
ncbi:MAG: hypothetical protein QHH10_09985 [Peptococcaceae bacterium]|jgi:hypothetical protein|nr:hypothetical protein [Peptococcaceae bacterium]MDH7525630.1 hypothetical protein [Peptococcaceae bacterium]